MDIRVFSLEESHRNDLETLLFQLSGKRRTLQLGNPANVLNVGVFVKEQLIGFAQLFLLSKTTFTIGHIEDVVVHEDYQNQGVGTQLMEKVITTAKQHGCAVLNLTTRSERVAAIKLFSALGFEKQTNDVFRLHLI